MRSLSVGILLSVFVACQATFTDLKIESAQDTDTSHNLIKRTGYSYTYRYRTRLCPVPGIPENGLSWYQSRYVGAIVVHTCKSGYVLRGPKLRTCTPRGSWSLKLPECVYTKCPDPGTPENSIRTLSSTTVNSIAKYRCKEGFRLAGSSYRVCQRSGRWSGVPARCVGTICEELSDPENGNVNVTSRRVGSTATYSCNTGFELVGNQSRVCRSGGVWSSNAPTCRPVNCGDLSNPQNGRVSLTSTTFGSTAKYSCDEGFVLVGSKVRQCQANGAWSRNPPICRPLSCGQLDSPENGKVVLSGTTPGSIASYSCNEGFSLQGREQRNCQNNGQWSGVAPVCRAVVCETLVPPFNGFITFSSSDDVQRPGDRATYGCNEGFMLSGGDRVRVCRQNMTYTGTAPFCMAITCGPLRDPPNGRVSTAGNNVGSEARYSCNRGFVLRGGETRTCQANGEYDGQEPSCQPVDCGQLRSPENGRIMIFTTRFGGVAKYRCNDGFELRGVSIRRCGPDGEWTGREPICRAVGCGQLSNPQNGRVEFSGSSVGSTALYTCNQGFTLIGQSRRRVCQRNSQWSGSEPSCRSITCEQLTNPANGRVLISGDNTPGSVATYSCNQGFSLVGASTRTCRSDGTYGGEAPVCREIDCGSLSNPQNGRVRFSSSAVGSRAAYTCNEGFNLVGVSQRICLPSRQWSSDEPRCVAIDCGTLPDPLNGKVDFTSSTFNSKASYSCNNGFELTGTDTRVCQENSQWSGTEPFCQPIVCEQLQNPENGFVVVRGNSIGAIATYSCNPGFRLVGQETRECQSDGTYTGVSPICEAINCDTLPDPQSGVVKFASIMVGATATYSCLKGFQVVGNIVRVCQPNGEWSGEEPTCSNIECGPLDNPENGAVTFQSTNFGSIAIYQCDAGFTLLGEARRTCQITGSWSSSDPLCQAVSCGPLDPPDNGFVRFTSTIVESTASYSCNIGFQIQGAESRFCLESGFWSGEAPICLSISCGPLIGPEYGSVVITGSGTNAVATYTCNDGFNLVGSSSRSCGSNGVWSGRVPTCQPADCGDLFNPLNGIVDASGTSFWDTATYRCNIGYQLVGEGVRTCEETGRWSGSAPFCAPVDCGFLDAPENGRVSLTGTVINSVATYICFRGFELVGDPSRTCSANGQWSGQEPFCKATECGPLPDPKDGSVSFDGITVSSIATYSCNQGFGIKGSMTRICQRDGTWSRTEPTCEPSDCGSLIPPLNGMIETSGTKFGDFAEYSCIPGFSLVGERTRTCGHSGVWSGVDPVCLPVDCGVLESPRNGQVDFSSTVFRGVALYTCQPGFQLVGERRRTCMDDGNWSGQMPSCQRIMCDRLIAPFSGRIELSNGDLVGSIASYFCFQGFTLDGNSQRTCQENMEWTGTDPLCRGLSCGPLGNPFNGQVTFSSTSVGSVARYSCNPGFRVNGESTRQCLEQGVWSGNEPICETVDVGCDNLPPILNGNVALEGTSTGDTATYSCNSGFTLDGNSVRSCLPNGQWSGQEPSCVAVGCEILLPIVYGDVSLEGTDPGDTAIYTCIPGFTLVGDRVRTCLSGGRWSGQEPRCVDVECPDLPDPLNGAVSLSGVTVGSTASYTCISGYVLSDSTPRTCQSSGQWSGSEPTCRAVDCGVLLSPAGGNVRLSGTSFGQTARYSCSIGFILEGTSTRVCQIDGTWSGDQPACVESQCPSLPDPDNGRVLLSGRTIGSVATYDCDEGFELIGQSTRICRDNQQWSGAAPTCRAIDCGPLQAPTNGQVEVTSTNFGSQAFYSCDTGFELVGVDQRTCQRNGVWSGQEPTCSREIRECPDLSDPANGIVTISGNRPGSSATYSCFSGFAVNGLDIRFCQGDGTWSGSTPRCTPVECPRLITPPKASINYIGSGFGAIARYRCDPGYTLVGVSSRTCKSDGEWSGDDPVCIEDQTSPQPDGCGDPGTPANGRQIGNSYLVGSVVRYECNDGYVLAGSTIRTCRLDGSWTGALPSCLIDNSECTGTGRVLDSCGRACQCVDGNLVNCCRLRKDYASLTNEEKERYVDAVLKLSTDPLYQSRYYSLLESYKASFDTDVYNSDYQKSQFFVWNRYFMLEYEDLLREIDCRITLPFYDWTVLPLAPYLSVVWDDELGFGKSSRESDNCVISGPFKAGDYSLIPSAGSGCLKREYTNEKFPSRSVIERDLLTQPASEFNKFHRHLQLYIHTSIRCFIGGTMCTKDAANDPVFILHLGTLDYIYNRWQMFSEDRLKMRYANDDSQLLLVPGHTVREYHDNKNLPNDVAVCYDEPSVKSHVPVGYSFAAQSLSEVAKKENHTMGCLSRDRLNAINFDFSEGDKDYIESKCKDRKK